MEANKRSRICVFCDGSGGPNKPINPNKLLLGPGSKIHDSQEVSPRNLGSRGCCPNKRRSPNDPRSTILKKSLQEILDLGSWPE